jgi:hypothetical protein
MTRKLMHKKLYISHVFVLNLRIKITIKINNSEVFLEWVIY